MRAAEVARRIASPSTAWLPAVIGIAVLLRVAGALYQGDAVTALPGIFDQVSYDELARRVAGGHGFSFAEGHWPATAPGAPTAHWSFLYTAWLAGLYGLIGDHPLVARLLQAVLAGVLQTWLAWRVGRRLFGPRVGTLAAAGTAVYAYFVYYAGSLVTEAFYLVAILWTIDAALRVAAAEGSRPATRAWIELGAAIGITALLRQVFLVFVPVLAAWIWWARRGPGIPACRHRDVAAGLLVTATVAALLILPWTARNYRAFGRFVLLNTNAGFALFWGNHPIHGTHFKPLLTADDPTYGELIPAGLRSLDEAALDRALLDRAWGFVAADPWRFVQLSASRAREYFKFWPSPDSGRASNAARLASFALFLPFMIGGLVIAARRPPAPGHDPSRRGVVLLYAWIVVYTGIHLASWTLIRYRLPVDAVLVVFAAVAADAVLRRFAGQAASAPLATAA